MLRPAERGWWRRRHTTGLDSRRGRTDTVRGRWPAHGCSTPPAPPTAWRCRPPPAAPLPAVVGASNAPVVHCSPQRNDVPLSVAWGANRSEELAGWRWSQGGGARRGAADVSVLLRG